MKYKKLSEKLAELEHEQWMTWAKNILEHENISEERKTRWQGMFVDYPFLSEGVKEHDRKWARKILEVFSSHLQTLREEVDRMKSSNDSVMGPSGHISPRFRSAYSEGYNTAITDILELIDRRVK